MNHNFIFTREFKRITLFTGHYGSGKTNCAVNFAMNLKAKGMPVVIADLDVVNPYFRTKDSIEELGAAGIPLIASDYAGSNVDFPALPGQLYALFDDRSSCGVLDIGGDDRGALALGRYRDKILKEDNYDNFLVINKYRPLTATPELCLEVMREIESAAGIPVTGIVNNSNLGSETAWEDIEKSFRYADEVSQLSGVPVVMTVAADTSPIKSGFEDRIFRIKLQKKIFEEA